MLTKVKIDVDEVEILVRFAMASQCYKANARAF